MAAVTAPDIKRKTSEPAKEAGNSLVAALQENARALLRRLIQPRQDRAVDEPLQPSSGADRETQHAPRAPMAGKARSELAASKLELDKQVAAVSSPAAQPSSADMEQAKAAYVEYAGSVAKSIGADENLARFDAAAEVSNATPRDLARLSKNTGALEVKIASQSPDDGKDIPYQERIARAASGFLQERGAGKLTLAWEAVNSGLQVPQTPRGKTNMPEMALPPKK